MYCFEHADWSRSLFITPKCVELLTYSKGPVTCYYKSLITKKKNHHLSKVRFKIHNVSPSIISLWLFGVLSNGYKPKTVDSVRYLYFN